jgi:hypothetical protein
MVRHEVQQLRARVAAVDSAISALQLVAPIAYWAMVAARECDDDPAADAWFALRELRARYRVRLRELGALAAVSGDVRRTAVHVVGEHGALAPEAVAAFRAAEDDSRRAAWWRAVAMALPTVRRATDGVMTPDRGQR